MGNIMLIDPVEDPRWDKFVEDHPFGWVCHFSGWKQVLEKSFKHMKGYYIVLVDENDKIKAGLPIYEVKSWITGKRLVSIPFATLSDPLISTCDDMQDLFGFVLELANKLGDYYIQIQAFSSASLIECRPLVKTNQYKHHYLSLELEIDEVRRTFHKMTKRNINKGRKSDLKFRETNDELDILKFYKLYCMTRKHLGLPPQPYEYIKMLCDFLFSSKLGTLLKVEHGNKLVAGGIFFKLKERFSNEFDAWDRKFDSLRPNYYLYWEAIKLAHSEGYKIFDFGRTSQYNEGLMDFKGRWGTTIVDLPCFYYPESISRKIGERENSFAYNAVSTLCKRFPDFAFQIMGNFIYRHLG